METKKKKAIVLDFDHTVFNTTKYKNKLAQTFKSKFGIDEQTFFEKREEVEKCCTVIDFDNFIQSFDYEDKLEMHHTIEEIIRENSENWVFEDVIPFMQKHKDEYDILIETHGDKEQQKEKIDHSHLPHYVTHIISTESKDKVFKDLVEEYDEMYFFDDKAKNIDAVKESYPEITAYFVQRPEDKPYADQPSKCLNKDFVIERLEEADL